MNNLQYTDNDIDVLARTIYGEARGEYFRSDGGIASLVCVANVIVNRAKKPKRYGENIAKICKRPYQFSCWNKNDPNCMILSKVQQGDDKIFDLCLQVAENVLKGQWPDLTDGANHYHASWMKTYPAWSMGHVPTKRAGQHLFYEL